MKRILIYDVLY